MPHIPFVPHAWRGPGRTRTLQHSTAWIEIPRVPQMLVMGPSLLKEANKESCPTSFDEGHGSSSSLLELQEDPEDFRKTNTWSLSSGGTAMCARRCGILELDLEGLQTLYMASKATACRQVEPDDGINLSISLVLHRQHKFRAARSRFHAHGGRQAMGADGVEYCKMAKPVPVDRTKGVTSCRQC